LPLAQAITQLGATPIVSPLTALIPQDPGPLPPDPLAFIATSPFAIDRLAALSPDRHTPLYVVGPVSEAIARSHGYERIHTPASPQVSSLKILLFQHFRQASGDLIYMTGRDITEPLNFSPAPFSAKVRRFISYRAEEVPSLSEAAIAGLREEIISPVLLFSTRAAHLFFLLAQKAHVKVTHLSYLCLSLKIGSACYQKGAQKVYWADAPTQEGMVEKLQKIFIA
jgi:uroporphyrinogen-III synthase